MANFFIFVGLIIMILSGGCTLLVFTENVGSAFGLVLLIGGVPFIVGLIIFTIAKSYRN